MTRKFFVDSFFYIALLNRRDQYHHFVVMEENVIREALTGDAHYLQAGFRPLI